MTSSEKVTQPSVRTNEGWGQGGVLVRSDDPDGATLALPHQDLADSTSSRPPITGPRPGIVPADGRTRNDRTDHDPTAEPIQ
jgi:hypothetical protein